MLKLGGIDNRPPKADQAMGKFRVARNVYCTPDNRLIPRYDNLISYIAGSAAIKCVHAVTQYGNEMLSFASEHKGSGKYKYALFSSTGRLPRSSELGDSPFNTIPVHGRFEDYPQQVQTMRNNGSVQYYLCPYDGTLVKYDGVEVSYAGVHQPILSCAQTDTAGTKYIKVVQNKVDFDGTGVIQWSEAVTFKVLAATTAIQLRVDAGFNLLAADSTSFNYTGIYATAVSGRVITPKMKGDIYYRVTNVTYYAILPTTGTLGITYGKISDNTWYWWDGTTYISQYAFPTATVTNKVDLPTTGVYNTLYRVNSPTVKYYLWQVNHRVTSSYASIGSFPVTGSTTVAYYDKSTKLIYFWNGSSYVLTPEGGEYVEVIATGTTFNTQQYSIANNDITITASDTNITTDSIGAYVIVVNDYVNTSLIGIPYPNNYAAIAYKIKAVTQLGSFGTPTTIAQIVLDANNVRVYNSPGGWTDPINTENSTGVILSDPAYRQGIWGEGTKNVFTIWASSTETGIYTRKGSCFSFPDTARYSISGSFDVTTAAITTPVIYGFVGGASLNGIFDITRAHISPNEVYDYGLDYGFLSMTTFNQNVVLSTDSTIWYSAPSAPRNPEMLDILGNLPVGTAEYGRMVAICGTNEFLFVSRERRNYYLTGNLVTGNIRTQNITETELGAWGNNCAVSIKDSVIFITAKGVYQTVEGGRTSLLSDTCPKNFNTFDSVNVNEDVVFKLDGTRANPIGSDTSDNSISIAYDEFRDLLVFMQKTAGNPALVLSTRTKEFYEWNGLITDANLKVNSLGFLASKYYLGAASTVVSSNAQLYIEGKSLPLSYAATYPIKLYTSWLTGGEPSLEKILLQLKIFGRIDSNGTTNSIDVCHYKDWDLSTKITNSQYFPNNTTLSLNDQIQYSHKKRLNSDKVLSASVGIESANPAVLFEVESLEVEFMPIQQGMKK